MLFLTYIQGPATTEWVHSISDWLEQAVQVSHEFNQRLWDYTEEALIRHAPCWVVYTTNFALFTFIIKHNS